MGLRNLKCNTDYKKFSDDTQDGLCGKGTFDSVLNSDNNNISDILCTSSLQNSFSISLDTLNAVSDVSSNVQGYYASNIDSADSNYSDFNIQGVSLLNFGVF